MDILLIVVAVLAVLAMSGWGYGYYSSRPAVADPVVGPGPAAWVNPMGILGLVLIIGLLLMLFTGWRPAW